MRNELRRSFFEKYSFYIPPAHKSFFSSEDMDRFLDARYDFVFKRTGDLKLKIENPASEFFWLINTTVIEALMPDSPFIIDTILDYLKSFDYRINLIVHPIFSLTRNRAGEMTAVDFAEGKEGLESYVYIEINRLDAKTLNDLRKVLTENLMSLRTIVADFSDMLGALDTVRFEKEENKTISRWISDNFIMLGLSNCENGKPVEPFYGEFRQNSRNRYFTGIQIETAARQESVTVYETEIFSRVNRRDRLYLCVFSDGRNSVAFIGQFSRKSALTPRYEIPLVREKLSAIALKMKAPQSSYLRKELFVAAQVFPAGIYSHVRAD